MPTEQELRDLIAEWRQAVDDYKRLKRMADTAPPHLDQLKDDGIEFKDRIESITNCANRLEQLIEESS